MKRLLPLFLLLASAAQPQCVMCYRTAESQNAARARVMDIGIVILGAPPFLLLAGFCLLCWRKSNTFAEEPSEQTRK